MRLLSTQEQGRMDRYFVQRGIPLLLLMESAGTALSTSIKRILEKGTPQTLHPYVDFFIGPGMNGGDLYVAARKLHAAGIPLRVWECQQQAEAEAGSTCSSVMREAALACGIEPFRLQEFESQKTLLVDGLLGTGFQSDRMLSAELELAFEKMADAKSLGSSILACDIPSGISANDGFVAAFCVPADYTLSFIAPKIGMLSSPACQFIGELEVHSLDLPEQIVEDFWMQDSPQINDTSLFPEGVYTLSREQAFDSYRKVDSDIHKWKKGNLLVLAGSPGMVGAAALSIEAALRTGTGLVTVLCERSIYPELFHRFPSVLYRVVDDESEQAYIHALELLEEKCTAVLAGPGWGQTEKNVLILENILEWDLPLTLDADALNLICKNELLMKMLSHRLANNQQSILTPHEGEAKRLAMHSPLSEIWVESWGRMEKAKTLAEQYNSILVLKGEATIIADADARRAYLNPTGGPGLAKGGSGDILAGMIAALCAQGIPAFEAAALATYIHGLAGDIASKKHGWRAHIPQDTLEALSIIEQL